MSSTRVTSEPAKPEPLPGRGRRRRLLAALTLTIVLAAGAVAWLWRHPDQDFPAGYGITAADSEVGQQMWTTLVHSNQPGATRVRITGLEPVIDVDGAAVRVEYVICELDEEALAADGVSGFGYGVPARDVERYCARTTPAENAVLHLRSEPREELIVGVSPTRPGRTVITGHQISFRVGWQRGTDEIDVNVTIAVSSGDR